LRIKKIDLTDLRLKARWLRHWCLDHPPQTALYLMVFVMISSHINFWLAWFALACFFIGGIGLIFVMLRDFVREERAQRERWRQRNDVQRVAMRRMQEKLAVLRSGRDAVAGPPSQKQSDQDES
jgi:hypothetical protein